MNRNKCSLKKEKEREFITLLLKAPLVEDLLS